MKHSFSNKHTSILKILCSKTATLHNHNRYAQGDLKELFKRNREKRKLNKFINKQLLKKEVIMKKLLLIVLTIHCSLFTIQLLGQPCLPEGITFTTQAQIDNFQTNYPDCSEIEGNVTINGDDITDLYGLNVLTSIGGDLEIGGNYTLTNLSGLENLASIGGDLIIQNNIMLTSLTGIENIDPGSIEDIDIINNSQLNECHIQSICDYLAAPNGSVNIFYNAEGCNNPSEIALSCGCTLPCLPFGNYYFTSQADIDNFQINFPGCTDIEGNVRIGDAGEPGVAYITNLEGLNVFTSISGDLGIFGASDLTNLSGFNNLTLIEGSITILNNGDLINLTGLECLITIGGNVRIGGGQDFGNGSLTSMTGLDNLTSIGGGLWIESNYALSNLTGLENLTSIGGTFKLGDYWGGNGLTSLSALNNLISIGGSLHIEKQYLLTSLSGLDNIDPGSILNIIIVDNFLLSECHVQSICDYLAAPNGFVTINYNAPGCNSPEEVQEACDSITSIPEFTVDNSFTITPNPLESTTIIKYNLSHNSPVSLKIFDVSGREIKVLVNEVQNQGEQSVVFNTFGLKPGIYFALLKTNEGMQTKKLIKLE